MTLFRDTCDLQLFAARLGNAKSAVKVSSPLGLTLLPPDHLPRLPTSPADVNYVRLLPTTATIADTIITTNHTTTSHRQLHSQQVGVLDEEGPFWKLRTLLVLSKEPQLLMTWTSAVGNFRAKDDPGR
ncbi:Hypothetical protein NTJ_04065 [Nesidiocoris tenuis]|uniref:Uncharacterized protein n=1 Tax=Nesidiocoris tenuis TaxID=355587 RepID=A0ABN7AG56_9HEMI|nr:Hypothetical protein NTJ_04065 [Nesidiocoris tenuis]